MLLGSSVHTVSERRVTLWYSDEVAQTPFPWGSVWMVGKMGPEMWLYLKAVHNFCCISELICDLDVKHQEVLAGNKPQALSMFHMKHPQNHMAS